MTAQPGLKAFQRRMAAAVMAPLSLRGNMMRRRQDGVPMEAEAAAFVKPNDRLTSFERLEIYNRQYWYRLLDCLREDYPGLRTVLGSTRFERLARAYLVDCPSTSFTLRDLGSRLESWLRAHPAQAGPHAALALAAVLALASVRGARPQERNAPTSFAPPSTTGRAWAGSPALRKTEASSARRSLERTSPPQRGFVYYESASHSHHLQHPIGCRTEQSPEQASRGQPSVFHWTPGAPRSPNTRHGPQGVIMNNSVKALLLAAAGSGLMSGTASAQTISIPAVRSAGAAASSLLGQLGGVPLLGASTPHTCKGQNSCKGQGGCTTSDMGCKGKNSCKGKGGCAVS
ncbi:MAG: DNA-binding domain-containing protein [Holophaga sp.]|jgi:hypothetical protein